MKQLIQESWFLDSKKELPSGPWMDEPDKIYWVDPVTGYDCLIVRNEIGALCGYVGVQEWHPAFGISYSSYKLSKIGIHGGLTYSNFYREGSRIGHVGKEDLFWFGFDCAHARDLIPGVLRFQANLDDVYKALLSEACSNSYRDIHYVKKEINHLAEQLFWIQKKGFLKVWFRKIKLWIKKKRVGLSTDGKN